MPCGQYAAESRTCLVRLLSASQLVWLVKEMVGHHQAGWPDKSKSKLVRVLAHHLLHQPDKLAEDSRVTGPSCATRAEADRIVLRNLDVIHDRTVVEFDEDGVRLDNGRILSWDQIETGRVEEARQADFDRLLRELGTDLYRIRQRLTVGDYRGLLPHAEALQDRFLGRSGDTAYMVFQSLMWARLEAGRREQAAVAYLHCLEYLTSAGAKPQHELPGKRRLQFDPQTGLTPELVPVWFDAEAARDSLSELTDTIARMRPSRLPAARIYHATLALAAGDLSVAEQALAELDGHDAWRALLRAQLQLAAGNPSQAEQTLAQVAETVTPELKPIMLYWLGTARLAQADRDLPQ
jgi:hypothetical protein